MELEAIKSAYFLEDSIKTLQSDEVQLQISKPQEPKLPIEPKLEKVSAGIIPYPPINPTVNPPWFTNIGIIIVASLIFLPAGILLYFLGKKEKERLVQQKTAEIQNSFDYKRKCEEIDEQNRQRQAQLDKELHEKYTQRYEEYKKSLPKYDEDVQHHKTVAIPEWNEEVAVLGTALTETKSALQELYSKNIVPLQYRNHSALQWLALFLGTSEFDLKTAIERYDTYIMQVQQRLQIDIAKAQLQLAQEQLSNQQYNNWLQEQLVELSEQGNSTLQSISNYTKVNTALNAYQANDTRQRRSKQRAARR